MEIELPVHTSLHQNVPPQGPHPREKYNRREQQCQDEENVWHTTWTKFQGVF